MIAMASAHSGSAWIRQGSTIAWSARGRERRHREAEARQLLPVQLGPLLVSGPDDRLAAAVDGVRHRLAALERHARDGAGERERDPVERVVIVVSDDHHPRPAGARPRTGSARLLLTDGRCDRRRHGFMVPPQAAEITGGWHRLFM